MRSQGAAAWVVTRRAAEAQGEFAWAGDMWNLTFHAFRHKINRSCR